MIGPRQINVDMKELELFTKRMEALPVAYGFAMRNVLNDQAYLCQVEYRWQASERMINRSPWTKSSIRFTKITAKPSKEMTTVSGSVEPYMKTQEEGEDQGMKGQKHGLPIPAGAPGARETRGKTPARNRHAKIDTIKGATKGIRQVKNASAIAIAVRKGGGVVFLNLKSSKGLYRVFPGTEKDEASRVVKIWDLTKRSVSIKENEMLKAASDVANQSFDALLLKRFKEQIAFRQMKVEHGAKATPKVKRA